jgi:hypothetical protein
MRDLTDWQKIFSLSRANGTDNQQHLLPPNSWRFPENTWLKTRLDKVRGAATEARNDADQRAILAK